MGQFENEIAFLERIAGVAHSTRVRSARGRSVVGEKEMTMQNSSAESDPVKEFFLEVRSWQSRARTVGHWCFFCGADGPAGKCGCVLPETMGCLGKRVCKQCAEAHGTIARHLQRMFDAKIVNRVSSIRARLYEQLHEAAEVWEEANGIAFEQSLHLQIASADPYEDSKGHFKAKIARAFVVANFKNYPELARGLKAEYEEEANIALVRMFSCLK
jgi:hypothetical protein